MKLSFFKKYLLKSGRQAGEFMVYYTQIFIQLRKEGFHVWFNKSNN